MKIFGNRIRVGDLLVQKGYITDDQLGQALELQREQKGKLGEVLIGMGLITEEQFSGVICAQLGIEAIDLKGFKPDQELFDSIGEDVLRKDVLIPIGYDENDYSKLKVAMADPMNLGAIDDVQIITGMEVTPVYASTTTVNMFIDKVYGKRQAMEAAEQFQQEHAGEFGSLDEEEEDEAVNDAPIVKIVNTILDESVRMDSSDIHIEPMEDRVRVRFRVDGVLQEVFTYPRNVLAAMVARIKIVSGLDISEKRKPQDGRLTRIVDGE